MAHVDFWKFDDVEVGRDVEGEEEVVLSGGGLGGDDEEADLEVVVCD